LKKLVDRLAQWDVTCYCTDRWKSYAAVIPAAKLVISKAYTEGIKRNHCQQRH
jgi:IS1 family transposase